MPTPWGYRNEIFYEHQGKLLDIGTVEHLPYQPVFNEQNEVIDIKLFKHSVAISAVGIQRIAMILNNLENVWEVETVKPMVEKTQELFGTDEDQAMTISQSLRVIHRIITDGKGYDKLNNRRKEYFRNFFRPLISFNEDETNFEKIKKLLELHSELENFYPELGGSVHQTINEIKLRKEAFHLDKSKKQRRAIQK